MTARAPSPSDLCAMAQKVAKALAALYGQRKSYAPALITSAMRKQHYPSEWDSWALGLFASKTDFDAYYAARGGACDFAARRGEMLDAIRPAPASNSSNASVANLAVDIFDFLT